MTRNKNIEWVRLGDYIEERNERNENEKFGVESLRGVTSDSVFDKSKAKTDGLKFNKYKIVYHEDFAYNPSRINLGSIAINYGEKCIISPMYVVFSIVNDSLLPGYLQIFFSRKEFQRSTLFYASGSVRDTFSFKEMCQVLIPLPSIKRQREIVDTWQRLRKMKEENEAIAAPLLQLCQSYIQDLKHNHPMVELGGYIEECNERNAENTYGVESLQGVTSDGTFDLSKAKTDGLKFDNYKIVKHNCFAYNPSRINIGSIALNKNQNCIISPMYVVFTVSKDDLLPEYLQQWFNRKEFQRSTLFFASGSVRDTFSYTEMCRVKIPLPPIDIQQAVVEIYRCANEAKQIAEEADRLSRDICPALMQHVIHENQQR